MYRFSQAIPSRSDLDWCWYLRREGALGDALERILHDIGVMTPGGWADWQPSVMTDTGAPVEMLFTAHQSSLCLRTEVADPATYPSGRVAKVCALMSDLGDTPPPKALRDVIYTAQSAGDLTFGAWLGLSQAKDKLSTTLFAEIPDTAGDLASLLLTDRIAPAIRGLGNEVTMKMVSYAAGSGNVTLHFDTTCAPADIVPILVVPAGVSPDPLLGDIAEMMTAGAAHGTPDCILSFSFTLHKHTRVPTLTLEVSSKAMFGNDTVIEAMARDYPGNHMEAYVGLAEQLTKLPAGKTHHGKIGLRANGNACPTLSLGVAAPWLCPDDLG